MLSCDRVKSRTGPESSYKNFTERRDSRRATGLQKFNPASQAVSELY